MSRQASLKKRVLVTNLGRILKSWRMIADIDMREAGKRIGISHPTFCRIEGGRDPGFKTMLTILNWLAQKEAGRG